MESDESSFYQKLVNKDIDVYHLSLYKFGIQEINKIYKTKSKPLASLHQEFLDNFEQSISTAFESLTKKYIHTVDKIQEDFNILKQKLDELISENEFLSKQIIDYKNSFATEKSNNQICNSLLHKEIFKFKELEEKYNASLKTIEVIFPNFKDVLKDKKFIKLLEATEVPDLNIRRYEANKFEYDPQKAGIIQDAMRILQ